jgi:hypothetical protein
VDSGIHWIHREICEALPQKLSGKRGILVPETRHRRVIITVWLKMTTFEGYEWKSLSVEVFEK